MVTQAKYLRFLKSSSAARVPCQFNLSCKTQYCNISTKSRDQKVKGHVQFFVSKVGDGVDAM
jgi:hypothetical protein